MFILARTLGLSVEGTNTVLTACIKDYLQANKQSLNITFAGLFHSGRGRAHQESHPPAASTSISTHAVDNAASAWAAHPAPILAAEPGNYALNDAATVSPHRDNAQPAIGVSSSIGDPFPAGHGLVEQWTRSTELPLRKSFGAVPTGVSGRLFAPVYQSALLGLTEGARYGWRSHGPGLHAAFNATNESFYPTDH